MNPNPMYDLAVRISMTAPGFSSALGAVTQQLGQLTGAYRTLTQTSQAYGQVARQLAAGGANPAAALAGQIYYANQASAAMERMQRGMSLLLGGGIITGVTKGLVDAIKPAIDTASQWQQAITQVGIASQGTQQQLTALFNAAINLSGPRMFSASQVLQAEVTMATSGFNQRSTIQQALPQELNVAEVDYYLRHIPIQESVQASTQLAHLFQRWPTTTPQPDPQHPGRMLSPQQQMQRFNSMLDLFARSQLVSGLTPDQMVNALSYLMPGAMAFGLQPEDLIPFAALGGNVGIVGHGARGGATLASVFYQLAPLLSKRGSIHNAAMNTLAQRGGTTWADLVNAPSHQFLPFLMTTVMNAMASYKGPNAGAERLALLQTAFGRTAARALAPLTTDAAIARYSTIRGELDPRTGLPSGATMQQMLNDTAEGRWITFRSTLSNVGGLLAYQLLPSLTVFLTLLDKILTGIQTFEEQHPGLTRVIDDFLMATIAVGSILGPVTLAAAAVLLLRNVITSLNISIMGTELTLWPVLAIFAALVVTIGTIVVAWQNWGTIMDTMTGHHITLFGAGLAGLISVLNPALGAVMSFIALWQQVGDAIGMVPRVLGALGNGIADLNKHLPLLAQILAIVVSPLAQLIELFAFLWQVVPSFFQMLIHWAQQAGKAVQDALGPLLGPLGGWLRQFIPDPTKEPADTGLPPGTMGPSQDHGQGHRLPSATDIFGTPLPGAPLLPNPFAGATVQGGDVHVHMSPGAVEIIVPTHPGQSSTEVGKAAAKETTDTIKKIASAARKQKRHKSTHPAAANPAIFLPTFNTWNHVP